ncbi:hypothetical protein CALVIDRAFT_526673 [Calocera viscosa TUFC12733]|uniref:Uncharacterized protein n=1 Tax=Calocera viscosa (strain TUFC12733) TaxID=1330018 RepID=A0A167NB47_CALVF|nr:hypothetical protein CALVIDRAFT_526673 [Calocera viscosa TUFC12733]
MAPCHPSTTPVPTPAPVPLRAQQHPQKRQAASSESFVHPASTGPVFPSSTDGSASSSTSYDLFGPLYPSPTVQPTGASISGGGTSALPSAKDVFIWIFVLIASGLVLLTALYRIWRLRQLNRSMSTFFRTGPSLQHPSSLGPVAVPPSDPRHPDHAGFYRHSQSAYPPFSYPSAPPRAHHPRVQGEGIGVGGRRLDSGYDADKEELPAYERGTLPGYGEVVRAGAGAVPAGGGYSMQHPVAVDGHGWEVVEMDRLGSPPREAGDLAPPPAISAPEEAPEHAVEVRPQTTGASNNPFRSTSPNDGNI